MSSKTIVMGLALAAALAGCSKPTPGSSAKGGNGSAAAGPAAAAGAGEVTLNPGEWESVSEVQIAGMANLPPQVAERMKNHKSTSRSCLTPEKAAHPGADFFSDKANKACKNDITMAGGRIQGSMTCRDPQGMASTITMDGTYGGDNYQMSMKMTADRAGQQMSWTSHSVGHRVGACTGKD